MAFTSDFCFICFENNLNFENTAVEQYDGIKFEEKLQCFLPENVSINPEFLKYACSRCLEYVNNVYLFRKQCIENIRTLNDYVDKRASTVESNNCLSITLADVLYYKTVQETPENITVIPEFIPEATNEYIDETIENVLAKTEDPVTREQPNEEFIIINNELTIKKPRDEKTYCKLCDKYFRSPTTLKRHNLRHTGERPYGCEQCEKRFTQLSALICHRATHSDERPYQCDVCFRTFKQKCAMTTHMVVHSDAKPFQCPYCQHKAARKNNLMDHIKTHTGEKPVPCKFCDKMFSCSSGVVKHVRRVHKNN